MFFPLNSLISPISLVFLLFLFFSYFSYSKISLISLIVPPFFSYESVLLILHLRQLCFLGFETYPSLSFEIRLVQVLLHLIHNFPLIFYKFLTTGGAAAGHSRGFGRLAVKDTEQQHN